MSIKEKQTWSVPFTFRHTQMCVYIHICIYIYNITHMPIKRVSLHSTPPRPLRYNIYIHTYINRGSDLVGSLVDWCKATFWDPKAKSNNSRLQLTTQIWSKKLRRHAPMLIYSLSLSLFCTFFENPLFFLAHSIETVCSFILCFLIRVLLVLWIWSLFLIWVSFQNPNPNKNPYLLKKRKKERVWGKGRERTLVGFVGTITSMKKERFVGSAAIGFRTLPRKPRSKSVLFPLRFCPNFSIWVAMITLLVQSFSRLRESLEF